MLIRMIVQCVPKNAKVAKQDTTYILCPHMQRWLLSIKLCKLRPAQYDWWTFAHPQLDGLTDPTEISDKCDQLAFEFDAEGVDG